MSYQVLARKYRPQCFKQMIGHEGPLTALTNALEANKLHHAYLLSGTRGIGKTSLARLLAKCLNCEKKVTSKPCQVCACCVAIQKNQFVDLIEVDGASRTRLEDTQSLLDGVQYKPTMGRYKVYLIDEVHMLSTHSFNALLKPLEEPPAHVIFLLATTDPQKIPDTIISRCLHFPLKMLSTSTIVQQLAIVLDQEGKKYDADALEEIATLAKGSVRDALSLLEPVILHSKDRITSQTVKNFFGFINVDDQRALLEAIHTGEVHTLQQLIQSIETKSIDFEKILDNILTSLNRIAWIQQTKRATHPDSSLAANQLVQLAQLIEPEAVQLYYQIALMGKKHLSLAPSPQIGFQMTLLRMLAFRPIESASIPLRKTRTLPVHANELETSSPSFDWPTLVNQLPLTGFLKSLALHCSMDSFEANEIFLSLDSTQKVIYSQERQIALQKILSQHLKKEIKLNIQIATEEQLTPAALNQKKQKQRKIAAYEAIETDANIQAIQKRFDATIQKEGISLNFEKDYE